MSNSILQSKIEALIRQLEEEVRLLSSSYQAELNKMKEENTLDLENLKHQFDQRIILVDGQYQSRIEELESEITYLKELNASQRLMMEDSLQYMKGLEENQNPITPLD